jgi:GT2 family glycosyltransferase
MSLDLANRVDLSICLVSWNTRNLLLDCLNSIFKNSDDLKLEVFVIDNNSFDGSAKMVEQMFPIVRLIANQKNNGFAVANNQGIELAKGRHLLLLNPDTIVLPGALQKMIHFLDDTPNAGAVAAKLYNTDGTLQYSVRRFPTLLTPFTENSILLDSPIISHFTRKSRMYEWDHNSLREVEQPAGAAFMIKRPVIETLGTLDYHYHMFFEDVDLCYRIRRNGWKIYYLPEAGIIHHGGQSVKQRSNIGEEFYKSLIKYFKSHYGSRGEARVRASMIIGSVAFIAYSLFRFFVKPAQAFQIAKSAIHILRCGFQSSLPDDAILQSK